MIPGVNNLALRPEILNSEFDYIPWFEEYGIRFLAKSNTRRRAGGDYVTRFQLKAVGGQCGVPTEILNSRICQPFVTRSIVYGDILWATDIRGSGYNLRPV